MDVTPDEMPCSRCGEHDYMIEEGTSLYKIACILKSEEVEDREIEEMTGYKVTVTKEGEDD